MTLLLKTKKLWWLMKKERFSNISKSENKENLKKKTKNLKMSNNKNLKWKLISTNKLEKNSLKRNKKKNLKKNRLNSGKKILKNTIPMSPKNKPISMILTSNIKIFWNNKWNKNKKNNQKSRVKWITTNCSKIKPSSKI